MRAHPRLPGVMSNRLKIISSIYIPRALNQSDKDRHKQGGFLISRINDQVTIITQEHGTNALNEV